MYSFFCEDQDPVGFPKEICFDPRNGQSPLYYFRLDERASLSPTDAPLELQAPVATEAIFNLFFLISFTYWFKLLQ